MLCPPVQPDATAPPAPTQCAGPLGLEGPGDAAGSPQCGWQSLFAKCAVRCCQCPDVIQPFRWLCFPLPCAWPRPREVSEWPDTVGGGGVPLPWTPPPPKTKVTIVGRNEIYHWEILLGHFWYTNFSPPPPSLLIHYIPAYPLKLILTPTFWEHTSTGETREEEGRSGSVLQSGNWAVAVNQGGVYCMMCQTLFGVVLVWDS